MAEQTFIDTDTEQWLELKQLPSTQLLPLAESVPQGSIHRLRMTAGSLIPVHFLHCDEYVNLLDGTIETVGHECTQGTFWVTPANTKNGPDKAITDVEILRIRLGAMGVFEKLSI